MADSFFHMWIITDIATAIKFNSLPEWWVVIWWLAMAYFLYPLPKLIKVMIIGK